MAHVGKLPKINRFITTHNDKGEAIFSDALPDESKMEPLPDGRYAFALSYLTTGFPVDLNNDADIKNYTPYLTTAPGLSTSNGSVLRHVDFRPGEPGMMHRTVSLDYGVVLEGEIICILDSGEERHLKRGDVCIQRGTMHAWKNPSETEWCRMMFVLLPCKEVDIGGKRLGEDIDKAQGIPDSK